VKLGKELGGLDAVCGTRVSADVAVLHDWESWWALELPSKPSIRVRHVDQLESYYRHLFDGNLVADFARPPDDLSGSQLVLAPSLALARHGAAARSVERRGCGGGRPLYTSTRPDRAALGRLLAAAAAEAGVKPVLEAPPGVSAVRRSGPRSSLLFLLNHRDVQVEVPVADPG